MGLKIFQKSVGPLAMNATLVMDEESKESIFFDPGDEIEKILDIANEQVNPVRLNKLIVHTELKPRDVPSCTDNTDHNKNGVLCNFQSFMCETTCAYAMLSACFLALMSVCVCLSRASWLPALVSVGVSVSCLASNIAHGTYFPAPPY